MKALLRIKNAISLSINHLKISFISRPRGKNKLTKEKRRQSSDHVFTVSEDEVRRELKRVNVRKAAGPDGITGRVLRSCADQLAGLFTSIFNESLATSVVPTSFKNLSLSLSLRTVNPLA